MANDRHRDRTRHQIVQMAMLMVLLLSHLTSAFVPHSVMARIAGVDIDIFDFLMGIFASSLTAPLLGVPAFIYANTAPIIFAILLCIMCGFFTATGINLPLNPHVSLREFAKEYVQKPLIKTGNGLFPHAQRPYYPKMKITISRSFDPVERGIYSASGLVAKVKSSDDFEWIVVEANNWTAPEYLQYVAETEPNGRCRSPFRHKSRSTIANRIHRQQISALRHQDRLDHCHRRERFAILSASICLGFTALLGLLSATYRCFGSANPADVREVSVILSGLMGIFFGFYFLGVMTRYEKIEFISLRDIVYTGTTLARCGLDLAFFIFVSCLFLLCAYNFPHVVGITVLTLLGSIYWQRRPTLRRLAQAPLIPTHRCVSDDGDSWSQESKPMFTFPMQSMMPLGIDGSIDDLDERHDASLPLNEESTKSATSPGATNVTSPSHNTDEGRSESQESSLPSGIDTIESTTQSNATNEPSSIPPENEDRNASEKSTKSATPSEAVKDLPSISPTCDILDNGNESSPALGNEPSKVPAQSIAAEEFPTSSPNEGISPNESLGVKLLFQPAEIVPHYVEIDPPQEFGVRDPADQFEEQEIPAAMTSSITQHVPIGKVKKTFVPPPPPDLEQHSVTNIRTTFTLNGRHFGTPEQFDLKGNTGQEAPAVRMQATFTEPNLRQEVGLKLAAKRAPYNPKNRLDNQYNEEVYIARLHIPARSITNFKYIPCSDMGDIPSEKFGLPKDFNSEDKAFIVIEANQCHAVNQKVPKLATPGCEKKLNDLFGAIQKQKIKKAEFVFVFVISIKHCVRSIADIFSAMEDAYVQQIKLDPMVKYIKDSPNDLHLRIGNIHLPHERPGLSTARKICFKRLFFQDRLEMKVFNCYALTEDHEWLKGLFNEYVYDNFQAVFAEIPLSKFADPTRPTDNNLPKQYKVYVRWVDEKGEKKLQDRPKEGDQFQMETSFAVPDVPNYTGPYRKNSQLETDEKDAETNSVFGGTITQVGPTAADLKTRTEELRQAQIEKQRRTWILTASPPSTDCPPNYVAYISHRPCDSAWEGPDEEKPRVGTIVPTIPTTFHNVLLFRESILKARSYTVNLTPIFSDKTYKSLMNRLHEFHEMPTEPLRLSRDIQCHVAQILTSMDLDLAFPKINLFDHAPPDYERYIDILSPLQKEVFTSYMSKIEHGIAAIQGCVASAKTMFAILAVIMAVAGSKKGALWVSETNEAVNDAARKIMEQCQRLGLSFKIIRIHSFDSESQLLQDKLNPRKRSSNFQATEEQLAEFKYLAQRLLNTQGAQHEELRKSGDKRRSPLISNLSLSEAMWEEMRDCPKDVEYLNLQRFLRDLADDAHDVTISPTEINRIISKLMLNTRAKADIEVTTCACAMQQKFLDQNKQYSIVCQDEAAKTVPYFFYGLVGAFSPSMFYMITGDTQQGLPYNVSATSQQTEYINSKHKNSTYSILARLIDGGFPVCNLWEAFRSYVSTLHRHISHEFYNKLMIDGTLSFQKPAEVEFSRNFVKKLYDVNDNWVLVRVSGSCAFNEDGNPSLTNRGHETMIMELVYKLQEALLTTELKFDKSNFTVKLISPYKAQVNRLRNRLIDINDPRFSSLTGKSVQGIEGSAVILHFPNSKKWTEFGNDKRDILVGITRQRYLLIIFISADCLKPSSYNLSSKWGMYKSKYAKNLFALYEYALRQGNVVEEVSPR